MPGPNTGTNRFGPSSYVVGTPANGLGNGVNFTSIQAAYNQAVADGYGIANPTTILIRPGQYTENLSITDGGIAFDCASNAIGGGAVIIDGNVTLTVGGPNAFSFSNITFTSSLNPTLTITGAAFPFRGSFTNCSFSCSDPGTTCIDISVPSGTFGFANFRNCSIQSDGNGIYNNSRTIVVLENSDSQSISGSAAVLDSSGRLQTEWSSLSSNAAYGVLFNNAANQFTCVSTFITSALTAIEMTVGGAANVYNSIINTSDASGFWVVGTGNLAYCDVINQGSAIGIDPGLGVITIPDWKPYAESGAAPGTGVVRGTSCFDSGQFSVVDGFVQALAAGLFPWIDQLVSTTVNSNQGNFTLAAGITLTLPPAPAQGDTCKFKQVTNDPMIIAANVGQLIQLGNTGGTTATSTLSGDAIELTWSTTAATWIANSSIGNWLITP